MVTVKKSLEESKYFSHAMSTSYFLHIKLDKVREDKVINISVRVKFNNIGSIETISTKSRLLLLGKILEYLTSVFQLY